MYISNPFNGRAMSVMRDLCERIRHGEVDVRHLAYHKDTMGAMVLALHTKLPRRRKGHPRPKPRADKTIPLEPAEFPLPTEETCPVCTHVFEHNDEVMTWHTSDERRVVMLLHKSCWERLTLSLGTVQEERANEGNQDRDDQVRRDPDSQPQGGVGSGTDRPNISAPGESV